jgi:hypothetical protein
MLGIGNELADMFESPAAPPLVLRAQAPSQDADAKRPRAVRRSIIPLG